MRPVSADVVAGIVEQWARERPDLDASPILVIGRIARIDRLIDAELRPPFAAAHLADGDFDVLAALRRLGAPYRCRPFELSRSLLVTTGGITKRLDRLERQHLVGREETTSDRRGKLVGLTDAGVALVDQLIEVHLQSERRVLDGLSPRDRAQLQALLGRLAAHLEHRRTTRDTPDRKEDP